MKNRWNDLKSRFFVSLLSICVIGILLVFVKFFWMKILLTLITGVLASVSIWEYVRIVKEKNISLPSRLLICSASIEVFSFFLASQYSFFQNWPKVLFFLFCFCLFLYQFRDIEGSLFRVALSIFGFLYIAVPLGMMLFILLTPKGILWFLYLLSITKITDIGAFFGGRIFGKRKLASRISPKKTLEGAFLGFFLAILTSLCFALFTTLLSWKEALFLGVLLGSIGQFGDLAESLLKRDAKVKDSNQLPGLGGFLDMIDSLLFNIPIIYFFLRG